ncbi:phage portal protein [Streptomyces bohaiensis]|uniref:phage portal protein n=1 Tax=Streptomyces bohaiensis TaxID=1431344 RepID=UPI003B7F100B
MATEAEALRLVDALESELIRRRPAMEEADRYYRGQHPLRFASDDFRQYHGERYAGFSDNWTQVVGDSPVERLGVKGLQAAGADRPDLELWRIWHVNGLDSESQLGFLGAGNSGRTFVLVWGDPDDDETPEVTWEDARQCIVAYEPGSRRRRRAALKRWQDGEREFATLYLASEVWKFERPMIGGHREKSHQAAAVDDAASGLILPDGVRERLTKWGVREVGDEPNPQPNPMGVVPMVELPNRPMLSGDPISDVEGVIPMQDAVNLVWSQLFVASDAASFPQRVILGAEMPKIPVLNSAGQVIGHKPVDLQRFAVDRVMWVTGKDARVANWPAADLEAYTKIIEVAVGHIAAQTRTPQHYLIGRMANLSGDALKAAETGLVKRVEEKQVWLGQGLREVAHLIYLARGEDEKAKAMRAGRTLWIDSESRSQGQLADALLKLKTIGFPFAWLADRWGLTPTEVADVVRLQEEEADRDPLATLAAMGGRPVGEPPPEDAGDEGVDASEETAGDGLPVAA